MNQSGFKVGVVILHYISYNDTVECIESSLDLDYDNYNIIVVDNGSPDDSFSFLSSKYGGSDKVVLLRNKKNQGFARGNNTGIDHARNNLGCEFVLAVNNDTVFIDKAILSKMISAYDEDFGTGLMGPAIICADGKNQNPLDSNITFYKAARDLIGAVIYFILPMEKFHKTFFYRNFIKFITRKNVTKEIRDYQDPILHGAALMFTPLFFKYFNGFYPGTFLYYEEYIVHVLAKKKNLISLYVKDAFINHKVSMSSSNSFSNKNSIKSRHKIKSIILCLKVMIFSKN